MRMAPRTREEAMTSRMTSKKPKNGHLAVLIVFGFLEELGEFEGLVEKQSASLGLLTLFYLNLIDLYPIIS